MVEGRLVISGDEFQAFMDAKGIERDCELCLQNQWRIPVRPDEKNLTVSAWPDPAGTIYFPGYAFYCGNCGNTKLLEASVVEQWVREHG